MYFFGKTDIGQKRATNQDAFRTLRLFDNCCLLVICDGMGGAQGGNIASELAIKFFTERVQSRLKAVCDHTEDRILVDPIEEKERIAALLHVAADRANTAVYERAGEDMRLAGMGTTLVAALVIDRVAFVVNIGDSRLYLIEKGTMRQVTKDHSYLQYLLDSGQIKEGDPEIATIRNVITRSIGNEPTTKADIYLLPLETEGFLLLCSDGLSGYVEESAILHTVSAPVRILEETDNDYELEDKVLRLIDLANEGGGGDNITAVLLKFTTDDTEEGRS